MHLGSWRGAGCPLILDPPAGSCCWATSRQTGREGSLLSCIITLCRQWRPNSVLLILHNQTKRIRAMLPSTISSSRGWKVTWLCRDHFFDRTWPEHYGPYSS